MTIRIRDARPDDLTAIVRLLADDPLGAAREREDGGTIPDSYREALAAIAADPNHRLVVGESAGTVVATLQLSFLPNLTYRGGWRAQIEGVRVSRDSRGEGVGRLVLEWAIARARERRCALVQLTTDRRRPAARAFYEGLGFVASHDGMKLPLS